MKKNNKGFVLAEAIVVAVFVLGMFTYLAMNVFPLITKYDKAINYNDPNEVYLANTFYEELAAATDVSTIDGVYSFSSKYVCKKVSNGNECYAGDTDGFCDDGTTECTDKTKKTICEKASGTDCSGLTINMEYYKTLAYDYLKIKSILFYNGSVSEINDLSRGMREFYNYSKNKFSTNTSTKILVEFQNNKYASLEI